MMKFDISDYNKASAQENTRGVLRTGSAVGAIAFVLFVFPSAALAQNECGVAPVGGGTVICDSDGNPYPNGVTYIEPADDLTIVLEDGVVIDTSGGENAGVSAVGRGDTAITVLGGSNTSITTSGQGAFGVLGVTASGELRLALDEITLTGDIVGGIVAGSESGAVTVDVNTISMSGANADGISASSNLNDVTVRAGTISTTGVGGSGIIAQSDGGDITIDAGTITTAGGVSDVFGTSANGITATTRRAGTMVINAGSVVTAGTSATGIAAQTFDGDASVNADSVTTAGANADGIFVSATGGDANVTAGKVTVNGTDATAINASSVSGGVSVTSTGSIIASGRNGGGILATSGTGDVTVVANDISTDATLAANSASSRAAIQATGANVSVEVNGTAFTNATGFEAPDSATVIAIATDGNASAVVNNLTAQGEGVDALRVTATNDATATINGQVVASGDRAEGVYVNAGNTAVVTLATSGSVVSADEGIVLISGNGSTLNNAGVIANSIDGLAVAAFGGPLTINNSGNLTSDILFTDGADRVNNTGTFIIDVDADFGAGADSFANSGTVIFASGATAPVSRTFTGLETFDNAGGLIELRNSIAGDTLALSGTVAGSADSRLGLDVDLTGEGSADRLILEGAATGSTRLLVDYRAPGALNEGVILVDGGAGTQAGAFTLDGGSRNFGLIETDLVFDAGTNDFSLVGAPNAAVYRTAAFVEGARNLWHVSADAWSAHMRELRDGAWAGGAGESGGRLWVQMHGAVEQRDNVRDVSYAGLNRTLDLGYDQDYFGGQIGFDFGGSAGEDGNFAFGITGGYVNSEMKFNGVTDRTAFDAFNAGAHAGINSGSLFANVLAKYDWYKVEADSAIGQYAAELDGNAYGAQGEIGFRLGSDRFFVEPVGSISYVRTDLDNLNVQNSTIAFLDDEGLRGKLGARLGASFPSALLNTVALYAGGNYVHEFKGDDSIDFTNNGRTVRIDNRAIGDYGEAVAGVNIGSPTSVSGFIEANGAKGSELDAYGARAGLRFRF